VHALVGACGFQRMRVPSDHHMPKRHRIGAECERRERRESSPQERAVRFDDAVNDCNMAAAQRRNRQCEADQGRWTCPGVAEQSGHSPIMRDD